MPTSEQSDQTPYAWLPAVLEGEATREALERSAVHVAFTEAADGTWTASTTKGDDRIGGPLIVSGHPTKMACEKAWRDAAIARFATIQASSPR